MRARQALVLGSALACCTLVACTAAATRAPAGQPSAAVATSSSTASTLSTPTATAAATSKATKAPPTRAATSGPRTSTAVPTTSPPTTVAPAPVPSGRTIVLNPGHNGGNASNSAAINRQVPAGFGEYKACDTTGTETNSSPAYPEHAFNWDVSLRVRSLLQAQGVTVILTRPSDSGVGPCVDERAAIGNRAGVTAVVSIHADGAPTSGHGFHVCEDSRQPAGAAIAAQSHALTVALHDSLLRGSGLTVSSYLGSNGYYPRSDLAGLNLATVPATFLEIGNMRNAGDAAEQSSPDGRQRIAQAVAIGILAWLNSR